MSHSNKTLAGNAMSQAAEYARQSWHVVVDDDVTLDDILRPAFWAHHANKIGKFALIDVVRQDGTLDVQLRVIETGVGFVRTRAIRVWEDAERKAEIEAAAAVVSGSNDELANVPLPSEYKISTNARGGFIVTFTPTDAKIAQGLKTRAAAIEQAKAHAKQAGIAWPDATPAETPAGA